MSLAAGSRLGPYEIVAPLGAGGMGEVYRAKDTRLERSVAIKVLASSLVATAEAKARFEREAKVISQLQHPHICTLYDVGSHEGTDFLVMELLEGESLGERLKHGPMPLDALFQSAIEIAEGLDRAHRAGVVHRDLKPGNVMLTKSGAKLLDFGLAKPSGIATAASASSSQSVFSAALTMSSPASPLSTAGAIVGTVQYMSPEQIAGQEADARSDVFAFGLLLYEMATGKRAFEGKTQASIVGAILAVEPPPVDSVQPGTPPSLSRLIQTCLTKDPDERYQTIHDVKLRLMEIGEAPTETASTAVAELAPARGRVLPWAIAAVLAAVAIVGIGYAVWLSSRPKPVVHGYILSPEKIPFSTMGGAGAGAPAISPDGSKLAFIARDAQGKAMLYVQLLSSATAQPLAGTEEASHPFWSPDGRSIGFFAGTKVMKIEASGGPAQTVCEAASANERGGSWGPDGTILFGYGSSIAPLTRVPSAGGVPSPALKFEPGESTHRWPQWLPDGKHFLFYADSSKPDATGIYVGSLDSPTHKQLLRTNTHAQYVEPGYLLFLRDQTLMAQPFNLRRLELTGEAVPVAERVAANGGIRRAMFSASTNGVLLYQTGASASGWQMLWYDRQGKQVGSLGGQEAYLNPAISPDGTRVAVVITASAGGDGDIWIFDLVRGTKTRLTFGPGRTRNPLWTPDGQSIIFAANRKGQFDIYRKKADNSGPEEVVLEGAAGKVPFSISHDGRYLAYELNDASAKTQSDLWALPLFGDRKPFPIVQTEFPDYGPAISPDGKWLAYFSNPSGRFEVFVTSFPGGGAKSQVSTSGGVVPHWRNDSRELYFVGQDQHLMAVDVTSSGVAIQLGTPQAVIAASVGGGRGPIGPYDTVDGKRFLVNGVSGRTEGGDPFTFITNWTGLLKK